jgi:UDP-N-acetylglucosamine--N-acetylmuramyl-(pentapeptide) pyrophosphoryl-undecaprenol N-acetylglucosamine transferase
LAEVPVRIVIAGGGTGGHVQPAIAVIRELKAIANVELLWIGSSNGYEVGVAREDEIEFRAIPTGKLRRYISIHTAIDTVRVPAGIVRARIHLRSFRPDVIFSTGGFVSVPTVVAGWLAGIPIITHEQTATIGLANRINARFANRIALAYERTATLLENYRERTVITGNPVRPELLDGDAERARQELGIEPDIPIIYITGGSLGAQALNNAVRSTIPKILDHAAVIHQCGPASINGDLPRLLETRQSLSNSIQSRYVVRERFGSELADIYAAADIIIGRAGAGTVAELALLGKPSILVPLPGAAGDEQTRNAETLSDRGGAILLAQSELSGKRLRTEIENLLKDRDRLRKMSEGARSVAQPGAARLLASEILDLARSSTQERRRSRSML